MQSIGGDLRQGEEPARRSCGGIAQRQRSELASEGSDSLPRERREADAWQSAGTAVGGICYNRVSGMQRARRPVRILMTPLGNPSATNGLGREPASGVCPSGAEPLARRSAPLRDAPFQSDPARLALSSPLREDTQRPARGQQPARTSDTSMLSRALTSFLRKFTSFFTRRRENAGIEGRTRKQTVSQLFECGSWRIPVMTGPVPARLRMHARGCHTLAAD